MNRSTIAFATRKRRALQVDWPVWLVQSTFGEPRVVCWVRYVEPVSSFEYAAAKTARTRSLAERSAAASGSANRVIHAG